MALITTREAGKWVSLTGFGLNQERREEGKLGRQLTIFAIYPNLTDPGGR